MRMLHGKPIMSEVGRNWFSLGFDLVTFRIFVAAVEEKSLARAAARERLALSSVSRRIADMEARSGVKLLHRHERGVSATAAGAMLYKHLVEIFALMERTAGDLAAFGTGDRDHVRLYLPASIAIGSLPRTLAEFLSVNPGVDLAIEEHVSGEILQALQTGGADIAVVLGLFSMEGFISHPWKQERLVVALPARHPLARHKRLRFTDLLKEAFIGLPKDNPLQRLYWEKAGDLGLRLRDRAHAASFDSVKRMVAAGLGVSILPEAILRDDPQIETRILDEDWAIQQVSLCLRVASSQATVRLCDYLLDERHESFPKAPLLK